MKSVSIIVGALAAFATAAPTEKRGNQDLSQVNNLDFNNLNFQYLGVVNSLNLNVLEQLSSVNNFNLDQFSSLFNNNEFNVQSALEFQQVAMLAQLAQLGVFSQFDLSSLNFNNINLGLINNVGNFDLNSVIDQSLVPQITQVVQTGVVVA